MQQMSLNIAIGLAVGIFSNQVSAELARVVDASLIKPIAQLAPVEQKRQTEERRWIALDDSQKPGASAQIRTDERESNTGQTVFDLTIPGFWMITKQGPDGKVYQKI
ncbi:MAG: hypothetical protein AB2559_09130, partial [Candidatus Thiodiazotropha endolucinida]